MFDNHIYLYLRGTSIQIEIKHDASTNELYNNIIGQDTNLELTKELGLDHPNKELLKPRLTT